MFLNGPISDRLRKLFGSSDPVWNPGRPADVPNPKRGKKLPKGVDGQSLGGRGKKGGKK